MRLAAATLTPLAIFLVGSTLLVGRFSTAADNPTTPTPVAKPIPSSSSSPTCIEDLTEVKGPVVVFGFEGEIPYSVEIDAKGEITTKGARQLQELPPTPLPFGFERNNISPSTVQAIVRLASANNFWRLPSVIGGDSGSDAAVRFVTVNLPCASRRVVVKDTSQKSLDGQRFAEVYMLLSDLVYEPVAYKPLQ